MMEIDGNALLMAVAVLANAGVIASVVYPAGARDARLETALEDLDKRVNEMSEGQRELYDRKVDKEACRERHQ